VALLLPPPWAALAAVQAGKEDFSEHGIARLDDEIS